MNPMKSNVLESIIDTLTKIGQKHVAKNTTMLSSLNIKDDMIKIAAKKVAVDSIERKLRTGYVYPISKEVVATPFTALPTQEREDKRKPRTPASAMGKSPSGSETTTDYNVHGGDQSPAASTLASRRSVKAEVGVGDSAIQGLRRWTVKKINSNGTIHIEDNRGGQWDVSPMEWHRLQNPENKEASIRVASSKISEVIQDLKQEDRIFVDYADVVMRLNQKGQESAPTAESLCNSLADEGITLIKTADQDPSKISPQPGMGYNDATDQVVEPGSAEDDMADPKQLEMGRKVELEHKETIDEFRQSLQEGVNITDEEVAEMIAKDHLSEDKEYYTKLQEMESGAPALEQAASGAGRRVKADYTTPPESDSFGRPIPGTEKTTVIVDADGKTLSPGDKVLVAHDAWGSSLRNVLPPQVTESDIQAMKLQEWTVVKGDDGGTVVLLTLKYADPTYGDIEIDTMPNTKVIKAPGSKTAGFFGRTVTAAEIASIKDDLNHAREQLKHYQGRLGEKGLEDGEKDRYQKSVTKWNKTIDRLDRELSRAMKADRKKERDEAKAEKAKEQAAAQPETTIEACAEGLVVTAVGEALTEPSFDIGKWMAPSEFQEFQRLIDIRQKTWSDINKREERNMQEGLPQYANIDYTEVEVMNTKIKHYQELAESRKSGEELPEAPEPEMGMPEAPEAPGMGEEKPGAPAAGGADEGVLAKKPEPMPEFASFRARMLRRAQMRKKAVTSRDFPTVCKNCKALCVPAGYKELSFLDHRDMPYCGESDATKNVGFRWAYMRDCRGYDPIVKEMTQDVRVPTETIADKLEERGPQTVLKKAAGYEGGPKNEHKLSPEDQKEAMERGKNICPKCVAAGYFAPRGEFHPVHDWHLLWNTSFDNVAHNVKGVCMPRSMNFQSKPDSGTNQFDTERNHVTKDK